MTITLTREEAQQVLDALINAKGYIFYNVLDDKGNRYDTAIEFLRARLSAPEPEPVAWMYEYGTDHGDAVNQIFWHKNLRLEKPDGMVRNVVPLYTAPPQREWQGLTDEEIRKLSDECAVVRDETEFIRAIEAKLKEKNAPHL